MPTITEELKHFKTSKSAPKTFLPSWVEGLGDKIAQVKRSIKSGTD